MIFEEVVNRQANNEVALFEIANLYHMKGELGKAIKAFRRLLEVNPSHTDASIALSVLLNDIGQYEKAQIWYWKYKTINPEIGEHFALSCDHAKSYLSEDEKFDISLFEGNSPSSDFGVCFYNNKLIYSSFRTDMKRENTKRNFSHVQKSGNQLFVCEEKSNAYFTNINFLRSDLKQTHNVGPLSYSGLKIAYTQNNFADGYKQITGNESDLNIFLADVVDENGDWDNDVAFEYNVEGSATAFPVLLNGGTTLIFASNRTGGKGNFDLYISQYEDGRWTTPTNLGDEINSPGNEITPSVHGNTLYFSSDFHSGIGGYDVFRTTINGDGSFSGVENLGKGINSPMDDYYYSVDPVNGLSYFSSTRLGGKGKEDIYVAKSLNQELFTFDGDVDLNIPEAVDLEELAKKNAMAMHTVTEENVIVKEVIPTSTPSKKTLVNEIEETATFEKVVAEKDENSIYSISAEELAEINAELEAEIISEIKTETKSEIILTDEKVITNISFDEIDEITSNYIEETVTTDVAKTNVISNVASTVVVGSDNYFSLAGARKIAYRDLITEASNVYFIQLASLSRTQGNINPFLKLSDFGNLYKVRKSGTVKIRMGYYFDEWEALNKLSEVKSRGFTDAFIVYEPLITSQLELVNTGTNNTYYEGEYIPTGSVSNYKVRLASYTDPLWFDTGSVKDIGEIEQWTKGEFTIFVLSGYSSYDEAQQALIKAINRGYSEAHVVEDINGYLQKVQRN